MYENSCHLDYGARAGEFVDACMVNIAWHRFANAHRTAAQATG